MNKKIIISFSIFFGVVISIIILCFTVFTVKDISVDFRTSITQNIDTENVVKQSQIKKNKCVFFLSKESAKDNIEKENPYLEVINIETIFPSKIVIHVAERQELFVIKNNNEFVFVDKDFKILRVDNNYENTQENAIELEGINIENTEAGTFIETNSNLKKLKSSMTENNQNYMQILAFIKKIEVGEEYNPLSNKVEENIVLTNHFGRKIYIKNISTNLNFKLQKMYQALSEIYELLMVNGDYTKEEVDRCSLVIGNQITNENELYAHIYIDGKAIESPRKT